MTKPSLGAGKRLPAARRGSMARGAQGVQIEPLVNSGDLQLSLFDDLSLAEISSPRLPGKRLVACKHRASHHDVDARAQIGMSSSSSLRLSLLDLALSMSTRILIIRAVRERRESALGAKLQL